VKFLQTPFFLYKSFLLWFLSVGIKYCMVYTHKEEENNGKTNIMQVLMIKSDKVYLITYTAEQGKYDTYLPTVQKMIDSFEFIKPHIIGKPI
jgi:hypothetical protein